MTFTIIVKPHQNVQEGVKEHVKGNITQNETKKFVALKKVYCV